MLKILYIILIFNILLLYLDSFLYYFQWLSNKLKLISSEAIDKYFFLVFENKKHISFIECHQKTNTFEKLSLSA